MSETKKELKEVLKEAAKEAAVSVDSELPVCGIVMPISDVPNYPVGHWQNVRAIIEEALCPVFDAKMVSEADEVTVIHRTIVQRLADDPLVICDLSNNNPNVMFELGMRLTFDKATILIIDIETTFSFDTSPIEHLIYPKDLRYEKIVEFKEKLLAKSLATFKKAAADREYSPFLSHFGKFEVSKVPTESVTSAELVTKGFDEVFNRLDSMERRIVRFSTKRFVNAESAVRDESKSGLVLRRMPLNKPLGANEMQAIAEILEPLGIITQLVQQPTDLLRGIIQFRYPKNLSNTEEREVLLAIQNALRLLS